MERLLEVLQYIIEKYNVSEEDFNEIQKALSELESGANEEFSYDEAETDEQ